jgi:hypothetical protein
VAVFCDQEAGPLDVRLAGCGAYVYAGNSPFVSPANFVIEFVELEISIQIGD